MLQVPAKAEQPTKSPKPPEQNQSKSVPEVLHILVCQRILKRQPNADMQFDIFKKTKTEGTQGIFEGTKLKRDPLSLLDSDKKQ